MSDAHMVEQIIKYSDGTETVIKYRGVIVDGVLISEKIDTMSDEEQKVEEVAETSAEPEKVEEVVAPVEESTEEKVNE